MDRSSLAVVGAAYLLMGTLVVLAFRRGNDARGWIKKDDPLLGSSFAARFWNNKVARWILGIVFQTLVIPKSERRAITAYGEVWISRLGWIIIILGGLLQVVAQF